MNIYAEEGVRAAWNGRRRAAFLLGVTWTVWTLIALFFVGQLYFTIMLSEKPDSAVPVFMQFAYCYGWALATPLVTWLSRRLPLERTHWRRRLASHVLACTLIVIVVTACFHLAVSQWYGEGQRSFSARGTARTIIYDSSQGIGIYCLITLIVHALGYYHRYQQEVLTKAELQTQLAEAQLQALKMQLHPHFLFNTLHSISALLHTDAPTADRMLARLGDFLRLTLENSGTQQVTLFQEIEFLKCYLDIERIRFRDRLATYFLIEPAVLHACVPNLILQPIVENAIKHGIAPRCEAGQVVILAERRENMLRIQVTDDGPGLPDIQFVNNGIKKGLGLVNTRARLERLYGAAHRFELSGDPGGGLTVTLEIPLQREEAEDHTLERAAD